MAETGTAVAAPHKTLLVWLAVGLASLTVFGLLWGFVITQGAPVGGVSAAMYLFSYAMGLTMIVLPCTLPLAFVIVPLAMGTSTQLSAGKGLLKGLGIALAFGLGVTMMLSVYGILAAVIGKTLIISTGASIETIKNWFYFVAGILAYIFALGQLGIINVRMPSYTGAAPAFIQKQQDYLKALLLGLFLGNIGVGCPHPATPFILGEIATSGNIFYGWSLFFVHAVGRVVPLLLLAILAILGVNGLAWLVARKDRIERATGWSMVYVAGFILVLGLFTHDWWVSSGQHTLFEQLTQEHALTNIVAGNLGAGRAHTHGTPAGTGLFQLPLWLGNWTLLFLWLLPLWWVYVKKHVSGIHLTFEEKPGAE